MPGERRSARRAGVAALLVALAAGCASPTLPGEAPAYDPTSLTGGVLVSWPLGRTVAVYVADGDAALAAAVARALADWEGAPRYGELRLRVAGRPDDADVVVEPAGGASLVDGSVCGGGIADGAAVTLLCFAGDTARTLPLASGAAGRVKVAIAVDADALRPGAALAALVAHELGHALGITGHSPDPADLMHGAPAVVRPSARDAQTLRYLLHQPADVRL